MPPVTLYSSPVFGEDVWIVDDEDQRSNIILSGDTRAVYLRRELPHMKELPPDTQRIIHWAKKTLGAEIASTLFIGSLSRNTKRCKV